ncbi:CO dehydrogenase/acetyl-CoA synthase subunit delta [Candidatus Bathyarchaeota archaeon ex4484_135]|nr:MAG: CO dehydrogenase/acetyl-CoA synthase subunit delta [Candidatus Bathyarchaeota archaeon ex4484_135]
MAGDKPEKGKGEDVKSVLADLLPDLLRLLAKYEAVELEDVELHAKKMVLEFLPAVPVAPPAPPTPPAPAKPTELVMESFEPPVMTYPGRVEEVKIGATRSEGGSRGRTYVIGGETNPPYYIFEKPPPHRPIISMDVFDTKVGLPKAVKMHIKDVFHDPGEWAKRNVDKFKADLVVVHLLSMDPLLEDKPPKEALKTVEEVLQAVDVPVVVGGCGDPVKDAEAFKLASDMFSGERLIMSSVTLDMADKGILDDTAKAIAQHGHIALAFTPIDLNMARELNRKLYGHVPRDSIIMDLTSAALGYGTEYSYTIMERARLAALMGDKELQHPIMACSANTWAAREAWMKEAEMGEIWGPRELRGPLYETVCAIIYLLAGADWLMVEHPAATRTLRELIDTLMKKGASKPEEIRDWVSRKLG